MAVKLLFNELPQFVDANGDPYSGAKLFTYVAGSSTKQTTYQDSGAITANSNPIVCDSAGRVPYPIWGTTGVSYKLVLAPSTDTDPPTSPIFTIDNVTGINDTTVSIDQWVSGPTPTYVSATSFTLAGDQTSTFQVGRRVKTTNSGGTVYSTITASAYAALTTITVVNDSGTLDSGLSAVSYGLLSAANQSIPPLGMVIPLTSVSGTNTITASALTIAAALQTGQVFSFVPANTNTGATTLNINSIGAKNVYFNNHALNGGELQASVPVEVVYDGTQFQIIGPVIGSATQTFLGADVLLNNTANYFNAINTGAIGVSGQVWKISALASCIDTAGAATFKVRIWDGSSTVYVETPHTTSAANYEAAVNVCAVVTLSAATTFYLSVKDNTSNSGRVQTTGNAGTANKASYIIAERIS